MSRETSLKEFKKIPGVGKSIAQDLLALGYKTFQIWRAKTRSGCTTFFAKSKERISTDAFFTFSG